MNMLQQRVALNPFELALLCRANIPGRCDSARGYLPEGLDVHANIRKENMLIVEPGCNAFKIFLFRQSGICLFH